MAKQAEAPPVIGWNDIDDLRMECEQVADLLTLEAQQEVDTRLLLVASMVREAHALLTEALWDLTRLR